MTIEELQKRQAQGEETILYDIREADELEALPPLPGAMNVPMGKVFTQAKKDLLPKDKEIIVYCQTGGRADIVVRELRALGYDVVSIAGGRLAAV